MWGGRKERGLRWLDDCLVGCGDGCAWLSLEEMGVVGLKLGTIMI
jgi:hypothetical protein